MSKIVLIGYMGVGKITLAKLLAEQLKVNWLDLDELIEKKPNYLFHHSSNKREKSILEN